MDPFHRQNRVRVLWLLAGLHMWSSFVLYLLVKNKKESMIYHWRWRVGERTKTHGATTRDRRFPANRIKNYVRYSNFHQARRNKRLNMIHLNWWCRDQNFRKYFELRKRHDIKPALSGFAHEPIHKATADKNWEIAQMRASREAR